MRRFTFVFVVLAIVGMVGNASADTVTIPVQDADFTQGIGAGSGWYGFPAGTGWTFTSDAWTPYYGVYRENAGDCVANLDHLGTLAQDLGYSVNTGDTVNLTFIQRDLFGAGLTAGISVGASSASLLFPLANQEQTMSYVAPASGGISISFVGAGGGIQSVGVTVTPVPEPSICAVLLTGILGLLAYAWRKRR